MTTSLENVGRIFCLSLFLSRWAIDPSSTNPMLADGYTMVWKESCKLRRNKIFKRPVWWCEPLEAAENIAVSGERRFLVCMSPQVFRRRPGDRNRAEGGRGSSGPGDWR